MFVHIHETVKKQSMRVCVGTASPSNVPLYELFKQRRAPQGNNLLISRKTDRSAPAPRSAWLDGSGRHGPAGLEQERP